MIVRLGKKEIPAIATLERKVWGKLGANEGKLRKRFERAHVSIGKKVRGKLIGIIQFSYSSIDPKDQSSMPDNFEDFSRGKFVVPYNAAFFYNFGMDPKHRRMELSRELLLGALDYTKSEGVHYVVADGRIPSYHKNLRLKQAIIEYISNGNFPSEEILLTDPLLRFYRMCEPSLEFKWIMPNFLPEDEKSGGHRVIIFKEFPR